MGRIKHNKDVPAKTNVKGVRNGSVFKNKNPKYKYTPTGKVMLVKNDKVQNAKSKKNVQNDNIKKPEKAENSLLFARKSPNDKQSTSKDKKKLQKQLQVSMEDKENSYNDTVETPDIFGTSLADDTDSDDEEFVADTENVEEEEEEDEDDDDNDSDSDLDDDDDESDSEVHKGVKMFRGIKSNSKQSNVDKQDDEDVSDESVDIGAESDSDDDSENVEDEEMDEEEDELDEEDDQILPGRKDVKVEDKDSDDDDDDEDEDEDSEHSSAYEELGGIFMEPSSEDQFASSQNESEENSSDDDDEDGDDDFDEMDTLEDEDVDENEDDEDDDEESDDELDANNTSLGLQALLGTTLDDDDDDEDFDSEGEDDEDDEISDDAEEDEEEHVKTKSVAQTKKQETESKKKKQNVKVDEAKTLSPDKDEEKKKRTIFIGNVPTDIGKPQLKKVFGKFGTIENMRIRGIVPTSPEIKKKVAAIKKQIHPKLHSVIAFITYKKEESAKKALSMNGKLFEGRYVRVDIATKSTEQTINQKKSVFLGNLSLNVDDNDIWEHFKKCGEIESVHVVRDRQTRIGKGFGYVNFTTEDAVTLALELDGTELANRKIRVKRYSTSIPKIEKEAKKRALPGASEQSSSKKFKKVTGDAVAIKSQSKTEKQKEKSGKSDKKSFQGQKAQEKKKAKKTKMGKKQKIMAAKFGKDKK